MSASMLLSYFIYYRVEPGAMDAARNRVLDAQACIAAQTGVRGRLLIKREEPGLWMEVYEAVPEAQGFEGALAEAARSFRLDDVLLPGTTRRMECFVE
jgi:hypothetical protein